MNHIKIIVLITYVLHHQLFSQRFCWMENASDAVRCIVYGITVYGNGEILTPPHKINTPEPIDKTFGTTDYVRNGSSYTKFGRNPFTGGFWANGWIVFVPFLLMSDMWYEGIGSSHEEIHRQTDRHMSTACKLKTRTSASTFGESSIGL